MVSSSLKGFLIRVLKKYSRGGQWGGKRPALRKCSAKGLRRESLHGKFRDELMERESDFCSESKMSQMRWERQVTTPNHPWIGCEGTKGKETKGINDKNLILGCLGGEYQN